MDEDEGRALQRRRQLAALVLAPLVIPALSLCRVGYLSMGGHVEKYWMDVLWFGCVSYVGSGLGALVVLLLFRVLKPPRTFPLVVMAFALSCGLLGLAIGLAAMPSQPLVLALLAVIGALLVGSAYCGVVRLPWRSKSA